MAKKKKSLKSRSAKNKRTSIKKNVVKNRKKRKTSTNGRGARIKRSY